VLKETELCQEPLCFGPKLDDSIFVARKETSICLIETCESDSHFMFCIFIALYPKDFLISNCSCKTCFVHLKANLFSLFFVDPKHLTVTALKYNQELVIIHQQISDFPLHINLLKKSGTIWFKP
jgi:hypothetical protein